MAVIMYDPVGINPFSFQSYSTFSDWTKPYCVPGDIQGFDSLAVCQLWA
jgi:hypothetical protein